MKQSLLVFEPTQFFVDTDGNITVGTDPEPSLLVQKFLHRVKTITEISFGGGTKLYDYLGLSQVYTF